MLSETTIQKLRAAAQDRGLAAIARELGVNRGSLASVLCGTGRPSTRAAVAEAFLRNERSKVGGS